MAQLARMIAGQAVQTGSYTGNRDAWQRFAQGGPLTQSAPAAAPGASGPPLVQTPVTTTAQPETETDAERKARLAATRTTTILGNSADTSDRLGA